MSFVKYRIREVANDFGVSAKDIADIVTKYFEKPKSNMQVLTDEQLNVVFDHMTQKNQIASLEQVFAAAAAPKAEAKPEAKPAPQQQRPQGGNQPKNGGAKPAQNGGKPQNAPKPAASAPQQQPAAPQGAQKQPEPQRKRERRVVDTSAVTVNAERFDDRVDVLVSSMAAVRITCSLTRPVSRTLWSVTKASTSLIMSLA